MWFCIVCFLLFVVNHLLSCSMISFPERFIFFSFSFLLKAYICWNTIMVIMYALNIRCMHVYACVFMYVIFHEIYVCYIP